MKIWIPSSAKVLCKLNAVGFITILVMMQYAHF